MLVTSAKGVRGIVFTLAALLAVLALIAGIETALAQPFGVPRPKQPPPAEGFAGWLLAKQAEFYRALSGSIRAAKTDATALWALLGLSFGYGIFHAAGPGHGKAVISSYLVANEETWRRGVVLSFASAMLQAIVAVAIVGIAAALLGATAKAMGDAVRWIEIVSYALIAAMGARLLWEKGGALIGELRARRAASMAVPAHHHSHHDHGQPHEAPGHHHHDHHHHNHPDPEPAQAACDHGHDHSGHSHGPEPQELAGPGGWKRGLVAIVAVGLRPCSGAILVLVFTLAQGLFWAGVISTFVMGLGTAITVAAIAILTVMATGLAARLASARSGYGSLLLRGVEVGAAVLVLTFGLALLAGYMANERLFWV